MKWNIFARNEKGEEHPIEVAEPEAKAAAVATTLAAVEPATVGASTVGDVEAKALRAELLQSRRENMEVRAEGWYEKLFAANKIIPAEREDAIASFVQASMDDAANPVTSGKSRVAMLKGMYDAKVGHTLTRPQLGDDGEVGDLQLPPGFKLIGQTKAPVMGQSASPADGAKVPKKDVISDLETLASAGIIGPEAVARAKARMA